jgi:DNA-binding PadR family transcriptional regulator
VIIGQLSLQHVRARLAHDRPHASGGEPVDNRPIASQVIGAVADLRGLVNFSGVAGTVYPLANIREAEMPARKRQRLQSPLALAVLALLFERPMHPYEMAATMRERHKEESIKLRYGSLYSVVEMLLRDGLIAPQETSRDGRRPERTVYAITNTGSAELTAWLSDLLRRPTKEYPQFMAALSLLPVLPPDTVRGLLTERLQHLDLGIQTRRGALAGVVQSGLPPLFLIEGDYEVALMEAERRFVQDLVARIAKDPAELAPVWPEFHTAPAKRRRKS